MTCEPFQFSDVEQKSMFFFEPVYGRSVKDVDEIPEGETTSPGWSVQPESRSPLKGPGPLTRLRSPTGTHRHKTGITRGSFPTVGEGHGTRLSAGPPTAEERDSCSPYTSPR